MSRFSQALQSIIDTRGAALRLAERSGIAASILSRLARGTTKQPELATLGQLMPVLSAHERDRLLTAWMLDYMPETLRKHLTVVPDGAGGEPEIPEGYADTTNILAHLSSTMRATIQQLAKISLKDEEFARMLYLCTRQWDPDWSAALDKMGVIEMAAHFATQDAAAKVNDSTALAAEDEGGYTAKPCSKPSSPDSETL